MISVYYDSSLPEKEAKKRFSIPEYVMMENAASSLEKAVLENSCEKSVCAVVCGSGNNGGDGLALSRRLVGKREVVVFLEKEPKTEEAIGQFKMAVSTGVKVFSEAESFFSAVEDFNSSGYELVFVDCLYGTGFHGELSGCAGNLISRINEISGYKISCDIPSGIDKDGKISSRAPDGSKLAFKADLTVTMGALKTALFTDTSIDFTGKVVVSDLGLSSSKFCECYEETGFLLQKEDVKYPVREKRSSHKGNYGHSAVVLGEKQGAGIIAGTCALQTGSGLVSCVKLFESSGNFLMSPELMVSKKFPENATALLLGCGLGRNQENMKKCVQAVLKQLESMKKKSIVLDADIFYYDGLCDFLEKLNQMEDCEVILTPHPKELYELLKNCGISGVKDVINVVENRLAFCMEFSKRYKKLTLVSKGAVTYILQGVGLTICGDGTNALAKGGSGDVLCGLCVSLLAQGYNAIDAARSAVFMHAEGARKFTENYSLTPLALIREL